MPVRERELRRYCKRLLRRLDIQPPLRVDELCRKLGEQRGKPIRLVPWALPIPGPFGLWMSRPDIECIFYQRETTRVHQDHIILHEIGHILADHQDDGGSSDLPDLGPDYPGDLVTRGLRRTCYTEDYEHEAELVATIIQEWATVIDYTTPREPEDSSLSPLRSALHPRWGWT
ncbi:hypothetical protein [Streptantibioticus cattleyicolor]|uniref:IrrE N-terminal-like domain-containing protein n=1 Tax=Streptantibioticus cattleyicolor (strain ATCC 35852 / DSM 46488 / JCM 4925 / NBRC 14057 / NRRL 8057) TaxID=1003195 RepID=G8XFZ0_STREN|nr:hypothetical protein [Streptantibioticus cattleyicolor]AEW98629.1 hypothetical protein SCATT_p04360 [Streptantibioticus cattleyicolor NRRL 8057 = DSM 46488]